MGEAFLRRRSEQYRMRNERVSDFLTSHGELFADSPSISTTTVTADLAPGADAVPEGGEVLVTFDPGQEPRVNVGSRVVGVLRGPSALEAARFADGRSPVVARVQSCDPLVRILDIKLARRTTPR